MPAPLHCSPQSSLQARPCARRLPRLAAGLDFGTSGARVCVIDRRERRLFEASWAWPRPQQQGCDDWEQALLALLAAIPAELRARLQALCLCATSGSVLWAGPRLRPLGQVLMYSDRRADDVAAQLRRAHPGSTLDALARLQWLWDRLDAQALHGARPMHQGDWLLGRLLGPRRGRGVTDWHTALKTGADPATATWTAAAREAPFASRLPRIVSPGAHLGCIDGGLARTLGLPPRLRILAGTTDANAAFLAAGADCAGQALSTLGSTLVLKLLSPLRIDAPEYGVYSHRFGRLWLVSGASHAGAAVLRDLFGDTRLRELSARIDPEVDSPLDLYPMPGTGERFPIADACHRARLQPRPADDVQYLHGLLQGLARIEAAGYARLAELGAPAPRQVLGSGGGAANPAWTRLRERALGVSVRAARNPQAAFGAARLALHGPAVFVTPEPAWGRPSGAAARQHGK